MADASTNLLFRDAEQQDVPAIIRLLANDDLGKTRESGSGDDEAYQVAFDAISGDPGNRLIVADLGGRVVGCMQVTTIPHMTFCGGTRLQIEGVRVDQDVRSQDIGGKMMRWAIDLGRETGCHLVQLTTNKTRKEAQRFYEKSGFTPSHIGYKCYLS
ncbi:MAG: GNAT family N-acetyltransferase [Geminicoccaceae bacterium]